MPDYGSKMPDELLLTEVVAMLCCQICQAIKQATTIAFQAIMVSQGCLVLGQLTKVFGCWLVDQGVWSLGS